MDTFWYLLVLFGTFWYFLVLFMSFLVLFGTFLVLFGSFWYFLVLSGIFWYFLVFLVLLDTFWYFLVITTSYSLTIYWGRSFEEYLVFTLSFLFECHNFLRVGPKGPYGDSSIEVWYSLRQEKSNLESNVLKPKQILLW